MKRIFIFFILMLAVSIPVSAADADTDGSQANGGDLYSEQYGLSGADELSDSLPDDAEDILDGFGIDPADYNWVGRLTSENVFSHIFNFLKSGCKAPVRTGISVIGVIMIMAAVSATSQESGAVKTAMIASSLSVAALLAVPVCATVNAAAGAIKGCGVFMTGFVPVFAGITAVSGAPVSAAAMSGLLLLAADGVTLLAAFAVLPLMGCYLAVAVSASVSPLVSVSALAEAVRKAAIWILSLVMTIFLGILSVQTVVNSAADSLAVRTTKFIVGSSVPVVGGALSEAVSTVTASMGLLKSSVGIYGVVAVAAIFLPVILELTVWRLMLVITNAVAQLFSQSKLSGLLKAVDMMLSLLLGVTLLTAVMFIISLTVVVGAGRAA